MDLLRMQVNPHFLYNTLASIHYLAEIQKVSGISTMAKGLSNLLRNIAKDSDEFITLAEELALLADYDAIQQIRYLGMYEIVDQIDEELKQQKIVKFSLQPVVENAIFHGIEPTGREGTIFLDGELDGEYLLIHVMDNGLGMDEATLDSLLTRKEGLRSAMTGVGLRNVDERLKRTYGPLCGLVVDSTPGKGTRVTIRILKKGV